MPSDQPDYTQTFTVNIELADSLRIFASKAESVTKKLAAATQGDGSCNIHLKSAAGYKIGLILVVATTDGASAELKLQVWLNDTTQYLIEGVEVEAPVPLVLTFPCWIPEQDVGDGVATNVLIYLTGSCGDRVALFAIYFEEEAS